jgi:hypothetical protein
MKLFPFYYLTSLVLFLPPLFLNCALDDRQWQVLSEITKPECVGA